MAPSDNIGSRHGCDSQNETYFMSNITPQLPSLNQKSWLGLEMLEASYAEQVGNIWVTAGPIFDPVWLNRLCSGVELPVAFYKIIVKETDGKPNVLAVIFTQQTKPGTELSKLVTTVDEIERRTEIDFLSELPDDIENQVESSRTSDDSWELSTKLNSNFAGAPRPTCVDKPIRRE
jgi:endonuclease G